MAARGAPTWNARALLYGPLRVTGAGDTQAHSALGCVDEFSRMKFLGFLCCIRHDS